MKNMMYISLQSYVAKVIPSDMNVVHRSYQMAIGTRGDIDTDIDIGASLSL